MVETRLNPNASDGLHKLVHDRYPFVLVAGDRPAPEVSGVGRRLRCSFGRTCKDDGQRGQELAVTFAPRVSAAAQSLASWTQLKVFGWFRVMGGPGATEVADS